MQLLTPETLASLPPAIVPRLITLFRTTTPELLADIRRQADSGNPTAMGRAAHKLKGSCLSLGAEHMAHLCKVLQHKGETGDLADTATLVTELENLYPATLAAMQTAH